MASFAELVRAGFYAAMAKVVGRETINPTVAAAGATQATATEVKEGFTRVTGANAAVGVRLPPGETGMQVRVRNAAAAVLLVYPATGQAINAAAANASYSVAANATTTLVYDPATGWVSFPLVAS